MNSKLAGAGFVILFVGFCLWLIVLISLLITANGVQFLHSAVLIIIGITLLLLSRWIEEKSESNLLALSVVLFFVLIAFLSNWRIMGLKFFPEIWYIVLAVFVVPAFALHSARIQMGSTRTLAFGTAVLFPATTMIALMVSSVAMNAYEDMRITEELFRAVSHILIGVVTIGPLLGIVYVVASIKPLFFE